MTEKTEWTSWNVNSLKELMEQRFIDSDKAVQAALLAAKEAVLKAETATEKRFEASNEFRAQLADQTATFLPRTEFGVQQKSLEDKVDLNARTLGDLRSRLDIGNPAVIALQAQEANRRLSMGRLDYFKHS